MPTDILDIEELSEGQFGKEVKINEALVILDAQRFPPLKLVSPELQTGWSWINQESAVLSTTNDVHYVSDAGHTAGKDVRIRQITAPATPYTLTVGIVSASRLIKADLVHGIGFRQNSDGKLHALMMTLQGIQSSKYTDHNAFSGSYTGSFSVDKYPNFLQISDNGTNRICRLSEDGINFTEFHSVGRTDFLTADRLMFFLDSENAAPPDFEHGATVFHWAVT